MAQGLQGIREAFTFDDVLLKPGLSDILKSLRHLPTPFGGRPPRHYLG